MELAKAISAEAVLQKKTAKLHIAADTGMTRIGYVYSKKAVEEILQISRLPGIEIEGMFTHFSCADMKDKTYSNMQRETFEAFLQALLEKGLSIPVVHMYNSAGVMEFDQYPFDMVRSGIVTYGLWPSDEVDKTTLDLHPALEWRAHVVNVKTVPAGVAVSYGATYVTEKETKIATVSVGYGDGYPRSLSSKGRVLVHGHTAQIIGRVCMDQMMVDVTDIPDVRLEDEVTLVGRDGEACITVEELSELSERFNYEFVCDISKRVTRLYV
jgi:alanine racemase